MSARHGEVAVLGRGVLLADVRVWRGNPQTIHHARWNHKGVRRYYKRGSIKLRKMVVEQAVAVDKTDLRVTEYLRICMGVSSIIGLNTRLGQMDSLFIR